MSSYRYYEFRNQSLFICLVAAIAALAAVLAYLYPYLIPTPLIDRTILTESQRGNIAPEPIEQLTFITLLAVGPTLIAALAYFFRDQGPANIKNTWAKILPLAIGCLFLVPIFESDFLAVLLGQATEPKQQTLYPLLFSIGASIILCTAIAESSRPVQPKAGKGPTWIWAFFTMALAIQISAWRIISIDSVTLNPMFSTHLDPVMFAIGQVAAGKTILVDMPSQYGLFPEILAPLFATAGTSVLTVTCVFAGMEFLSLSLLFHVLKKVIRTRLLLALLAGALILITFENTLFIDGYEERYFQYWPIRFFWPALSVFVFYLFCTRRTLRRSFLASTISAIAVIWNLDTGIFVALAFGAYLMMRAIFAWRIRTADATARSNPWNARTYLVAICIHGITIAAGYAAFLFYLASKGGQPLNFGWIFQYQQIFARLGFAMLPLPLNPHPWMMIIAVYIYGLVSSLFAWREAQESSVKSDLIFYLSTLGLGLFFYYVGRSHVFNLMNVIWPAFFIAAIGTDTWLRLIKAGKIHASQLALPITFISLVISANYSLAIKYPYILDNVYQRFSTRGSADDPLVKSEMNFIKTHTEPRKNCVIYSLRQGIYHAETGTASPLEGSGIIETLLQADENGQVGDLLSGKFDCIFLGVGQSSKPPAHIDLAAMHAVYSEIASNPERTMVLLARR